MNSYCVSSMHLVFFVLIWFYNIPASGFFETPCIIHIQYYVEDQGPLEISEIRDLGVT